MSEREELGVSDCWDRFLRAEFWRGYRTGILVGTGGLAVVLIVLMRMGVLHP